MIRKVSFKHGWYYQYRVHVPKVNELSTCYPQLMSYLDSMFTSCPHSYFESGPRSSKFKVKLPIDTLQVLGHEVSSLTRLGLDENHNRFSTDHPKVQVFMLEHDGKTVAMETPVWLMPDEMEELTGFKIDEPITGHIDVLRIEGGKVWIWDYKPNASLEKFASTQVLLYALMLSRRTGIPLDNFMCGYFDSANAYIFKPKLGVLKQSLNGFL